MKKLLAMVAVGVSAVAAIGDPITLTSVGITRVDSSLTNTILSVSYKDLAAGGDITVSNLVKTINLVEGDELRVYSYGSSTYTVFTLGSDGFWKAMPGQTLSGGVETTDPGADPGETTLSAGVGLWLVRDAKWNGEPFTFYLYGKPTTPPSSAATGIEIDKDKPMLCGNCTGVAKAPKIANAESQDRIIIPAPTATGTRIYTYNGTKWQTRINKVLTELTNEAIPAGTGFWYVPNNKGSTRKLYWE